MPRFPAETMQARFCYNPETGNISCRRTGRVCAQTLRPDGYLSGSTKGFSFLSHRAAWAIHFEKWPQGEIDHINGDKSDNRLQNLRVVSSQQNKCNRKIGKHNTSGVMGVIWHRGKWNARIKVRGKLLSLGYYDKIEDAAAARKRAEAQHGFHPNHGRMA